jgi:hypothetical protein
VAALDCAEEADSVAARIGAANTLVRTPEGKLKAYNTDWSAAIAAVEAGLGGECHRNFETHAELLERHRDCSVIHCEHGPLWAAQLAVGRTETLEFGMMACEHRGRCRTVLTCRVFGLSCSRGSRWRQVAAAGPASGGARRWRRRARARLWGSGARRARHHLQQVRL